METDPQFAQFGKENGKIKQSAKKHISFKVWERDCYTCKYCGLNMLELYKMWKKGELKRVKGALITIDHVIPLSKGGGWEMENLNTCCYMCNQDKGDNVLGLQKKLDIIACLWGKEL